MQLRSERTPLGRHLDRNRSPQSRFARIPEGSLGHSRNVLPCPRKRITTDELISREDAIEIPLRTCLAIRRNPRRDCHRLQETWDTGAVSDVYMGRRVGGLIVNVTQSIEPLESESLHTRMGEPVPQVGRHPDWSGLQPLPEPPSIRTVRWALTGLALGAPGLSGRSLGEARPITNPCRWAVHSRQQSTRRRPVSSMPSRLAAGPCAEASQRVDWECLDSRGEPSAGPLESRPRGSHMLSGIQATSWSGTMTHDQGGIEQ